MRRRLYDKKQPRSKRDKGQGCDKTEWVLLVWDAGKCVRAVLMWGIKRMGASMAGDNSEREAEGWGWDKLEWFVLVVSGRYLDAGVEVII